MNLGFGTGQAVDTSSGVKVIRAGVERGITFSGAINEKAKFGGTDFRNIVPRFSEENKNANQSLVELLETFASQKMRHLHRFPSVGYWPKTLHRSYSGNHKITSFN